MGDAHFDPPYSVCNSECVFTYIVKKRTTNFVTFENEFGDLKRVKAHTHASSGIAQEIEMPEGKYSMRPVLPTNS